MSNKVIIKERKAYKELQDQIKEESKYFCGEEKGYSNWYSPVLEFIQSQNDKKEIIKQQQCKKDNPNTYKTKCVLYCMTGLCRSGYRLGSAGGTRG